MTTKHQARRATKNPVAFARKLEDGSFTAPRPNPKRPPKPAANHGRFGPLNLLFAGLGFGR